MNTLGIDLGTSWAKATANLDNGKIVPIVLSSIENGFNESEYTMPTVLLYAGHPSVNHEYNDYSFDVIYGHHGFKIGQRAFKDQTHGIYFSNFKPKLSRVDVKSLLPAEIDQFFLKEHVVAIILQYIHNRALSQISGLESFDKYVITVPASHVEDDARMDVMQRSIVLSGIDPSKCVFVMEPEAAGYYLLNKYFIQDGFSSSEGKRFLVYDFGGSTFDCTIFRVENSVIFIEDSTEKSNFGRNVGGIYIDEIIRRELYEQNPRIREILSPSSQLGIDRIKREELLKLVRICPVDAKLHLTKCPSYHLSDPEFDIHFELSQKDFYSKIEPLIDDTIECCDQLLQLNNTTWSDIDAVILVGGSSRIPMVLKKIEEKKIENEKLRIVEPQGFDRINAVSSGAALYEELRPSAEDIYNAGETRRHVGDYSSAEHFYRLADAAGHSNALYQLGRLYYLGRIGDPRKRFVTSRKIFESSPYNMNSIFMLSLMYARGNGLIQNFDKAKELLSKCTDLLAKAEVILALDGRDLQDVFLNEKHNIAILESVINGTANQSNYVLFYDEEFFELKNAN